MRRVVALVLALTTASPLAGCIAPGCGAAEDLDKGTEGQWVLTRELGGYGCPIELDFEQMVFEIRGDVVTVASQGMSLRSARVYQDGERKLVDMTVGEGAVLVLEDGSRVGTTVDMDYTLELVPVTARLEGSVTSDAHVDTETGGGSCGYTGSASAGRVAD